NLLRAAAAVPTGRRSAGLRRLRASAGVGRGDAEPVVHVRHAVVPSNEVLDRLPLFLARHRTGERGDALAVCYGNGDGRQPDRASDVFGEATRDLVIAGRRLELDARVHVGDAARLPGSGLDRAATLLRVHDAIEVDDAGVDFDADRAGGVRVGAPNRGDDGAPDGVIAIGRVGDAQLVDHGDGGEGGLRDFRGLPLRLIAGGEAAQVDAVAGDLDVEVTDLELLEGEPGGLGGWRRGDGARVHAGSFTRRPRRHRRTQATAGR